MQEKIGLELSTLTIEKKTIKAHACMGDISSGLYGEGGKGESKV